MTRVLMLGPVNHPHVEHLALAMHEPPASGGTT